MMGAGTTGRSPTWTPPRSKCSRVSWIGIISDTASTKANLVKRERAPGRKLLRTLRSGDSSPVASRSPLRGALRLLHFFLLFRNARDVFEQIIDQRTDRT